MERQPPAKVQKTPLRVKPPQAKPEQSRPASHPLLGLQRSVGNRAVQRLINSPYIQAKLQVSTPEDPSEQEADRMAETVMRMTLPEDKPEEEKKQVATKPLVQKAPLAVREDEDEETVATVYRMCADCEEEKEAVVHRKAGSERLPDDEAEDKQ